MKGIFVCIMVVVASAFTSCINDKKSCQCTGVAEGVTAVTVVRRLRFGLLYNCGRRSYGLYRLRVVLPLFEGWRIGRITLVRPFLFVGR